MELLDLNNDELLPILNFMDPADELALSKTCIYFKNMCQSGWTSLTLNLGQETEANRRKVDLTPGEKEILDISGDNMQNIHICIDFSAVQKFDELSLFTKPTKWTLKKFTFDAVNIDMPGTPTTVYPKVTSMGQLLKNCLGLTYLRSTDRPTPNAGLEELSLSVHSWNFDSDRFRVGMGLKLLHAHFYDSLKSLALDCFFACDLNPCNVCTLPSIYDRLVTSMDAFGNAINNFRQLTKLDINARHLTRNLLRALSHPDRASLQIMTVVVDNYKPDELQQIPQISWQALIDSSPSLEVSVETLYNVNTEFLKLILPACVPTVSWKIYSLPQNVPYGHNSLKDFMNHLCVYKQTLQSVAVQNGSEMCHSHLLEMIPRCSKVHTLCVQGQISSTAILEMASLQRQWIHLGVWENDLTFPNSWEENREKCVARLCREVSEKLGCSWKPESEVSYQTVFNRPVILQYKQ